MQVEKVWRIVVSDHRRGLEQLRAEDGRLVLAARSGDREAFGQLVGRWSDRCWEVAWRILHDRELAADVAQDTLMTAWRQLERLGDPASFGGWVLRIARNRALDRLERERRTVPTDDDGALEPAGVVLHADPVDEFERGRRKDLVWAAAAAMGERDASVLDLLLRHGLEPHELADALDVTPNAAHQVLFRLRQRLGAAIRAWLIWRGGEPACVVLGAELAAGGFTEFGGDLVRAVERHATTCDACAEERERVVAPAALFSAVPLMVMPAALRTQLTAALADAGVPVPPAAAPAGDVEVVDAAGSSQPTTAPASAHDGTSQPTGGSAPEGAAAAAADLSGAAVAAADPPDAAGASGPAGTSEVPDGDGPPSAPDDGETDPGAVPMHKQGVPWFAVLAGLVVVVLVLVLGMAMWSGPVGEPAADVLDELSALPVPDETQDVQDGPPVAGSGGQAFGNPDLPSFAPAGGVPDENDGKTGNGGDGPSPAPPAASSAPPDPTGPAPTDPDDEPGDPRPDDPDPDPDDPDPDDPDPDDPDPDDPDADPPVIDRFSVTTTQFVCPNRRHALHDIRWATRDGHTATLTIGSGSPQPVDLNGSEQVCAPLATTVVLAVTGEGGMTTVSWPQ